MKASVLLSCVAVLALGGSAHSVTIETVPVGNVGNTGEWSGGSYGGSGSDRICGAVDYEYNIGKYEVTVGQYTEFLNAVARTDTYGLYSEEMWTSSQGCKILQSGSSGEYVYTIALDRANRPVNYISFGDAARFTNWLANGQPTGLQDPNTTENGSYALLGATGDAALLAVEREADAGYVIPSEDEWYKAAFYDSTLNGSIGGYYDYATGTDLVPDNNPPWTDTGNSANYYDNGEHAIGSPYYASEVGAYEASPSYYGTFDQNGNIFEWVSGPSYRGIRGGSLGNGEDDMRAADRSEGGLPSLEYSQSGFRVAFVPEPASLCLLGIGGLTLFRRSRPFK